MSSTLYFGGRILTMVGDNAQYVEAVVEKDGKIAFTGSVSDAKELFPDATEMDLQGRCMMPGHIDPHLHPSMAALILRMHFITPFDWILPSGKYEGVRTEVGYRERLRDLILQQPKTAKTAKTFLITWGYHQDFHGEMSKSVIDEITPAAKTMPIAVWQRSFHEVYLNSYALDYLTYDDKEALMNNPQVDWERGHFYEMGLDAIIGTTNFGKDTVFPMMMDGYNDVVQVRNKAAILAGCLTYFFGLRLLHALTPIFHSLNVSLVYEQWVWRGCDPTLSNRS